VDELIACIQASAASGSALNVGYRSA